MELSNPGTKIKSFSLELKRETRPKSTPRKCQNLILPGHKVKREEVADDRHLS